MGRWTTDERLARRVAGGDDDAFAVLFSRHHTRLLSFCRYLLGGRDEAEEAVQQSFMRLHSRLQAGQVPDDVRSFLYAIARNRCRSLVAARGPQTVPLDDREALEGLPDLVQRREDLRELVRDIGRLPEEQRAALVLAELGDLRQDQIARVLDVPAPRVRALVFQARSALVAERDARERPCADVRLELATASGGTLRRAPLRRHLRRCEGCRAFRAQIGTQRSSFGALVPGAAGGAGLLGWLGAVGGTGALVKVTAGVLAVAGAGMASRALDGERFTRPAPAAAVTPDPILGNITPSAARAAQPVRVVSRPVRSPVMPARTRSVVPARSRVPVRRVPVTAARPAAAVPPVVPPASAPAAPRARSHAPRPHAPRGPKKTNKPPRGHRPTGASMRQHRGTRQPSAPRKGRTSR